MLLNLLFTTYVIQNLYRFNKIVGIISLCIIVTNAISINITGFSSSKIKISDVNVVKSEIYSIYPNDKFDIYGCSVNEGNYFAYPLAYLMYKDKINEPNGRKIGICFDTINTKYAWEEIKVSIDKNSGWWNRNPQNVYEETAEWWVKNPPGPTY